MQHHIFMLTALSIAHFFPFNFEHQQGGKEQAKYTHN